MNYSNNRIQADTTVVRIFPCEYPIPILVCLSITYLHREHKHIPHAEPFVFSHVVLNFVPPILWLSPCVLLYEGTYIAFVIEYVYGGLVKRWFNSNRIVTFVYVSFKVFTSYCGSFDLPNRNLNLPNRNINHHTRGYPGHYILIHFGGTTPSWVQVYKKFV